jgi:hypothetical protein
MINVATLSARSIQRANVILVQVCAVAFATKQSSSQVTWHQPTSLASSPLHPSYFFFFPSDFSKFLSSNPIFPIIYSTELSPFSETASHSATQEFQNTRRSINVLTTVRHCFLSWARLIQLTHSHPISPRSILLPFSHLRLDLPSYVLPSGFHTKKTIFTILSHTCYMPCPFHSPSFGNSNSVWRGEQVMYLLIMRFILPIISYPVLKDVQSVFSLNAIDQFSQPY